jgi:hypothetical protein
VSYLNLLMGDASAPLDSGVAANAGGGTASAATGTQIDSGIAANAGAGTNSAATGTFSAPASVDLWTVAGSTNDYIGLPASAVFGAGARNTFTFECYVKMLVASSASWQTMLGFGATGDDLDVALDGNLNPRFFPTGPTSTYVFPQSLWKRVTWIADAANTRSRLLIDGVQQGADMGGVACTLSNTQRRLMGDGSSEGFKGRCSDIRIWNIARTTAACLADYNKRLVGNESGLVGYWKCNEGTGTTVADSTSGAATGTFSSGTNVTWVSDSPTFV